MTKTTLDEMFDDLVDYWHDNYDGMLELHELIGISWEEYQRVLSPEEWSTEVKECIEISYWGYCK